MMTYPAFWSLQNLEHECRMIYDGCPSLLVRLELQDDQVKNFLACTVH